MQPTNSIAAVAIIAALGVSACGRGSTSSQTTNAAVTGSAPAASSQVSDTGSAATDCAYISAAQLSQIEGATYAAPTVFHRICSWTGSDGNALSITLTGNASEADWQTNLAVLQRDQSTDATTPIAGLGDRAAGAGLEIAVQHGGTIIDIRNGDSPGFGKWPKSTAIANAIIAGLH
jgi:hypothetical protein